MLTIVSTTLIGFATLSYTICTIDERESRLYYSAEFAQRSLARSGALPIVKREASPL